MKDIKLKIDKWYFCGDKPRAKIKKAIKGIWKTVGYIIKDCNNMPWRRNNDFWNLESVEGDYLGWISKADNGYKFQRGKRGNRGEIGSFKQAILAVILLVGVKNENNATNS